MKTLQYILASALMVMITTSCSSMMQYPKADIIVHLVQPGECVSSIYSHYGVSPRCRYAPLRSQYRIYAGEYMYIYTK